MKQGLGRCYMSCRKSESTLYFAFGFVQTTGYECATSPNTCDETPLNLQNVTTAEGPDAKVSILDYRRSAMQPEWNALYVKHNHEKAASRFLAAHCIDHYLPLYTERSVWANRCRVVVERPVFPGYLFVCFAPEQRKLALRAPGVVCLAGKERVGTITLTDIESLRKAIACGERPRLPHCLATLMSSKHRPSKTAGSALVARSVGHTDTQPARRTMAGFDATEQRHLNSLKGSTTTRIAGQIRDLDGWPK
jgi:hypothetical protein